MQVKRNKIVDGIATGLGKALGWGITIWVVLYFYERLS